MQFEAKQTELDSLFDLVDDGIQSALIELEHVEKLQKNDEVTAALIKLERMKNIKMMPCLAMASSSER